MDLECLRPFEVLQELCTYIAATNSNKSYANNYIMLIFNCGVWALFYFCYSWAVKKARRIIEGISHVGLRELGGSSIYGFADVVDGC